MYNLYILYKKITKTLALAKYYHSTAILDLYNIYTKYTKRQPKLYKLYKLYIYKKFCVRDLGADS